MNKPLDSTEFSAKILKKCRYSHDAMIDAIIANPGVSEIQLGEMFGYSKQWVSRLLCSDAFQARLALRKGEIIDPKLTATVEERMSGVMMKSLDIILENLEANPNMGNALKAFELTSKGKAYGARQTQAPTQVNFVVALPGKAPSEQAWEDKYSRGMTIEGEKQ